MSCPGSKHQSLACGGCDSGRPNQCTIIPGFRRPRQRRQKVSAVPWMTQVGSQTNLTPPYPCDHAPDQIKTDKRLVSSEQRSVSRFGMQCRPGSSSPTPATCQNTVWLQPEASASPTQHQCSPLSISNPHRSTSIWHQHSPLSISIPLVTLAQAWLNRVWNNLAHLSIPI